jgi:hypothetical protein
MKIRLTKRGQRHVLQCIRQDGSAEVSELGPNLPYHDLAHFVVERQWSLAEGFFGNIARGFTPAQLSAAQTIRNLGPQSMQAEILTRALQSLCSGACAPEQFAELVNTELAHWRLPAIEATAARVELIATEYRDLTNQYRALRNGESLTLEFEHP